jgi:hypothetical protein
LVVQLDNGLHTALFHVTGRGCDGAVGTRPQDFQVALSTRFSHAILDGTWQVTNVPGQLVVLWLAGLSAFSATTISSHLNNFKFRMRPTKHFEIMINCGAFFRCPTMFNADEGVPAHVMSRAPTHVLDKDLGPLVSR